jgi:transposase InsO family protein
MDYMGPLPETSHGNKHILVVVDHFTKWCEAFATPDQKASTVAPLLISRIFSRFGPPAVLHSDQGRNFESILMHEICDAMGITKTRATAYHPQCDGKTERQNRTLQSMLSSFVSSRKDDWDSWLDCVTFAYNTSRHDVLQSLSEVVGTHVVLACKWIITVFYTQYRSPPPSPTPINVV